MTQQATFYRKRIVVLFIGQELLKKSCASFPFYSLYRFASADVLKLKGDIQIVEAARLCLERSPQMLYEPIVVELEVGNYRLLDVHQLLVAQSHLHEMVTQMLTQHIRQNP